MCACVYLHLLVKHGTVMPLAAWYYTAPFQPAGWAGAPSQASNHDLELLEKYLAGQGPPDDWRPSSRIVVTLSTLPHHMEWLSPTLESLTSQSLRPDDILLALPIRSQRTGKPYSNITVPEGVTVIRSARDYGPVTKLVPALHRELDPDTLIITVDDDKVYHKDLVRHLAWHAEFNRRAAFGVCGWSFMWMPRPLGVVPAYVEHLIRGTYGVKVDVLQAVCGIAYRRGFFNATALETPVPSCFTTDDMWISGYLANVEKVDRVLLPRARFLDWAMAPAPFQGQGLDKSGFQLSKVNSANMQDIKCIDGLEALYGTPWRTVASAAPVEAVAAVGVQ